MEHKNGYDIPGEWKNSTCGKIALAERSGKKYFIKRYKKHNEPENNGGREERKIDENKEK